jgi:hypothetical protein
VEYDVVIFPPAPPLLVAPPPLTMGADGGPGMVLTEDGAVSFVSSLTKNFNLDATRTADQYVFKLHNPGARRGRPPSSPRVCVDEASETT